MKAMCIQDNWKPATHGFHPVSLEVVTVSQCPIYPNSWDVFEYPCNKDGRKHSFLKKGFLLISDIDETEMVRENLMQTL